MPPPNAATPVNVCTSPPLLTATNTWPTFADVLGGAKCQAPIEPCWPTCARKLANVTPPEREQVPGPTPAGGGALNVSGSQASIMLTVRSGNPAVAAAALELPGFGATELEATADGLNGVRAAPSVLEALRSQPTVRASATIDATTTERSRFDMKHSFSSPRTRKRAAAPIDHFLALATRIAGANYA